MSIFSGKIWEDYNKQVLEFAQDSMAKAQESMNVKFYNAANAANRVVFQAYNAELNRDKWEATVTHTHRPEARQENRRPQ